MGALTSRAKQAIETKRKIFDTSISLFAERGFDCVSIHDICEACGLSVGGFYHHFKSKTDILDEGYRLFDLHIKDEFDQADLQSPIEALFFLFTKQSTSVSNMGYKAFSQYLNNQLYTPSKYILDSNRAFTITVHECIKKAVHQNILRGEADQIAEELLSATRGLIYDWCLHSGSYDLIERTQTLVKMSLLYYKNSN